MISKKTVHRKLWHLWLWMVDLWEFVVLLTLGFHPARSIISLHGESKETCDLITTCLEVYRRSTVGSSVSQIKDLLSNCDPITIAKLTTDDGYNLLQLAVQKSDIQFVEYLLSVKKVNPNICKCSMPLHIALNIGSINMVRLLLSYKAKIQQQMGMCFPQPHVPVYSSHSKFFFVSPSMVCGGVSKDAYQRAIDKDNVELLQLFLQRKSSPRLNVLLLHYACSSSAMLCIKHLVEVWNADVNATDNKGFNAIMHSLHSNIEIIHYLVAQGAEIGTSSYKAQTVLHKLYCDLEAHVPDILEKTRLFFALGADDLVNNYDVFRNTALHYLCITYAAYDETGHEQELRHCLGLLLSHNAETSIADSDGFLPLLRILQCSCLSSTSSRNRPGAVTAHTHQHTATPGRADRIYNVLRLFTQYSPSSTQSVINKENETSMFYILRMCFDYEDSSYLKCINFLRDNGANINHVAVTQLASKSTRLCDVQTRSLIAVIRDRALQELKMVDETTSEAHSNQSGEGGVFLVNSTLQTLFQSGLDPNAQQIECRTSGQAENVIALACFSQLIQESHSSSQLELVHKWIRLILQWGGDPELQLYRPEPQICTSQGSIFLKQATALPITQCFVDSSARHWSNNVDGIQEVVTLLSTCMSQLTLQRTLKTSSISSTRLSQISIPHPVSNPEPKDDSNAIFLNTLVSQPQTLQAITCFQIYKSLNRKVYADRMKTLPIPTRLKARLSQINW